MTRWHELKATLRRLRKLCEREGFKLYWQEFDYGFAFGVAFEDPRVEMWTKPRRTWRRWFPVARYGPYRAGLKTKGSSEFAKFRLEEWVWEQMARAHARRHDMQARG